MGRIFRYSNLHRVQDPRPLGLAKPGLGDPAPLCNCDSPQTSLVDRTNFVTLLVSMQYLVILCADYCGQKRRIQTINRINQQRSVLYICFPSYLKC